MDKRQEDAFWATIEILNQSRTLPHIMVIGSWAEYLYSFYYESKFLPVIRTRDVDFLYRNIRRPSPQINLEQIMTKAGFVIIRDRLTEVVKMLKEDLLEVEFLTRQVGAGQNMYMDIPGIGIRGQSLRDVNILSEYPIELMVRGYDIIVPEPAIYMLQKIMINPHRMPISKREKDIESVRNILPFILASQRDAFVLHEAIKRLSKKNIQSIKKVCDTNFINHSFIDAGSG